MTDGQMTALVFLAGGFGTLSRFGISRLFHVSLGWSAPWGTMVINIVGCLGFGLLAEWFQRRAGWPPEVKTVVLTGFFGAFTTFSTYIFELQGLTKEGNWLCATGGFLLQNGVGFAALILGILLARQF